MNVVDCRATLSNLFVPKDLKEESFGDVAFLIDGFEHFTEPLAVFRYRGLKFCFLRPPS
jgi:hypothetical protein